MSEEAIAVVAQLMELAARTAPKGAGQDFIEVRVVSSEERERIGREMIRMGDERSSPGFRRDGQNVLDSSALVLIGLLRHPGLGIDCRACGFDSCAEFNSSEGGSGSFDGPNCAHRLADLGIAVGSAVKTASMNNVDNRVMYRAGEAAKSLGLVSARVVYGVPLSATGKNIYFDRKAA